MSVWWRGIWLRNRLWQTDHTEVKGVWTGRAARVLSVGFLGVSEETLEGEREPIMFVVGRPDLTEKYRQEKLRRAFLHRVARHLGQQAGALQRARDAVK